MRFAYYQEHFKFLGLCFCVGFSLVVVLRLLIAVLPLLWNVVGLSMGTVLVAPGLQSTGSIVVAHGLSCCTAFEILSQGIKLVSPALAGDSLPLNHQGSPQRHLVLLVVFLLIPKRYNSEI